MAKSSRSALGAISFVVAFVGLGVSLSGCPIAAPLENEDRFDRLKQSGGTGNVGGSGSMPCDQALPDGPGTPEIACDYQAFMRSHCARSGCHNATTASAKLDLTTDAFLIARILEVDAKHEITCPAGAGQCNLTTPQCPNCMDCAMGDKLLTKADIPNSWMMVKMDRFNIDTPSTAPDIGCGTAMPYPPGGTGYTAERRDCLKRFFTWVANNGRACSVAAGGSGGGGAGGAGTAGAGSGGGGAGGT